MAVITLSELINRRVKNVADLSSVYKRQLATFEEIVGEDFRQRGGCEVCRGRGWVVTWDTLDMLDGSCHTSQPCPEPKCTPETRCRSGLKPDNNKYDKFHVNSLYNGRADPRWQVLVGIIQEQLGNHNQLLSSARIWAESPFTMGDRVRVVRGRKLPIGTEGYISFIHNNGGLLLKTQENYKAGKGSPAIGWANSNNLDRLIEVADW